MRMLVALFLALFGTAAYAAPQNVVSINLCTDQLAILMLEPERLRSVSFLALDPTLSNTVAEARAFAINDGSTEAAIAHDPDLILAGFLRQGARVRMIETLGYPITQVPDAQSIAESLTVIEDLAETLGVPDRGRTITDAMRADLEDAERGRARPLRAILLQPRGGTVGAGTLVDDVMRRAGLVNVAAEMGIVHAGTLSIEQLVAADPDLIILDDDVGEGMSLARAMLDHPALRAVRARDRVVRVPTRLWWCPGPWLVEAVQILRDAADGISPLDGRAAAP
ncbi:MAG: ABC transporter substrate-binding protein [Sphingomonadales bacterium]